MSRWEGDGCEGDCCRMMVVNDDGSDDDDECNDGDECDDDED